MTAFQRTLILALLIVFCGQNTHTANLRNEVSLVSCLKALRLNARHLEETLTPCAFGKHISKKCCLNLNGLVNIDSSHSFSGCLNLTLSGGMSCVIGLCLEGSTQEIMKHVQSHPVAQSIGFDVERVTQIFEICETHVEGTHWCEKQLTQADL